MKLNNFPKNYIPLSQHQSDEESGLSTADLRNQSATKISLSGVNILQEDGRSVELNDRKSMPLSSVRRICLIASLFVCILFVISFVYFTPCSIVHRLHGLCQLTSSWKNNQSNNSPVDLFHSKCLGSYFVICGCSNQEPGVTAIENPTREECWRLNFHYTPSSSLCSAIEFTSECFPECLVVGTNGFFNAVNLMKGACLCFLQYHSKLLVVPSVDLSMLMPDTMPDMILNDGGSMVVQLVVVSAQIVGSALELRLYIKPVTSQLLWKKQNESASFLYCIGKDKGLQNLSWSSPSLQTTGCKSLVEVKANKCMKQNLYSKAVIWSTVIQGL